MDDIVLKIENLSKQYRLGLIGTGTISHDLNRWFHKVRGKEDPYLKIGETNNRTVKGGSDYVWALRNINFEVKRGEVVGIIGRNGAGKSTLLKILSKVTGPTQGRIRAKGRVASLLEVGTGFHPELTGKENIYLNGAILGMTRQEIKGKLDQIINFSGIERYIDTPVKRYSSGMFVRLAFAVAAHLDPEILIIDEVLAVGDAEFQKKCLGKIDKVSKTGRTVLFVSHDLNAVRSICTKGILIENGEIQKTGNIEDVIHEYLNASKNILTSKTYPLNERPGNDIAKLNSYRLIDENKKTINSNIFLGQKFGIELNFEVLKESYRINPCLSIYSAGQVVFISMPESNQIVDTIGNYKSITWFPENILNEVNYTVRINMGSFYPTQTFFDLMDPISFNIIESDKLKRNIDYKDTMWGMVRPELKWKITKNNL
jgi:lipopolysaccharide transport system ATP-binding protein